jgi:hypothetical protein
MDSNQHVSVSMCTPHLLISLLILSTAACAQTSWTEHIIDVFTYGTASIHACDLDNDGDTDVLGAVLEESDIVWWCNDGGSPLYWTKFTIDPSFLGAVSVYAADNDNDQDVIGGAAVGNEIAWWENGGGNPISWTKHSIEVGFFNVGTNQR